MKLTATKYGQLPDAIKESIHERGLIEAAIFNTNKALSYYKYCKKTQVPELVDYSLTLLNDQYNELLNVEHLANKYSYLWLETFCKAKHYCEKYLQIGLI